MRVVEVIIIIIHVTGSFSKKKNKDRSSESIENILYYKDCNHKQRAPLVPLVPLVPLAKSQPPPAQQECKMCCTMCCGNQCVDSHQLYTSTKRNLRTTKSISFNIITILLGTLHQMPLGRQAGSPLQPDMLPPRERRKKQKFPFPMQPLLPARRVTGYPGFTRETIKSLISQDEDIRKILRDLVRVTMQKADLMQMMNGRQAAQATPARADDSDPDNDL
ncbi:uncharacterized protein LOC112043573 [Bicyclus anynana]|uniref:Uncharacterized protein LOC112043573 n=1 Tax=Bicyclus anynana TaxID=110368 RepID=A0ABM3LLK0_BICAN|nr:uncharacterized protein LOC112043573 [Bicyclus anynana]